jgi:tetratricopeptide (TPR) repeat protein
MSARAPRNGDAPLTFFIAYAAPDAAVADRLSAVLTLGATVFLDRRSVRPGDDWDRELAAAQRRAEITVVLVSDHTEKSFYQREEIATAIDMARQGPHRVVPLWLSRTGPPDTLPYGLGIKQGLAVPDPGDLTEVARALLEVAFGSEPAAFPQAAAMPSAAEVMSISAPIGQLDHPVHGRDALLNLLSRALRGPYGEFHVLAGMGGAGKTTVALELARRAADQMPVWWVTAASPAALAAGMRLVAATLGASADQLDRAWGGTTIGPANLLWTLLDARHGPWLLVIDNADDPRVLVPQGISVADHTGWVRPARNGVVVVTTRDAHSSTWGLHARVHPVGRLPPADAVRVLFDLTAGRGGTEAAARRLADRLGGLPLALRHAGSYLSSTARAAPWPGLVRDFAAYASALDDAAVSLLDNLPLGVMEDEREDRRIIARTFELSLDLLTERGARYARPLLRLLSCLADAPIPYVNVLDPTRLARSPEFAEVDYQSLARQLQDLAEFGLVDLYGPDDASGDTLAWTVTLHPVVRAANAAHPDVRGHPGGYPALATELVWALADDPGTETDEDPNMWSRWRVLAPHAFHLLRQLDSIGEPVDTETASQACRAAMLAARCLFALGLYEQAQDKLGAVRDTARRLLGPEHPDVELAARHQLARVLVKRGRHKQAETDLREVLKARRRLLGDDHLSTLATRNQLAWTLHAMGRDNDAEPELRTVLDARLRILGDDHPDTLVTRMDLAEVWHAQGRQQQAETGYRTVLDARRRILGEDHPKVLNTRADLARLWHEQGRPEEAEAEYRAVVTARRRVLGEDHPKVLNTRADLARLWHEQGRLEEAEAEYRAVITARRRILGEDHPNTLTSRHNLASVLNQQGRRQHAEAEYRAVLDARCRVLGEDHPDTLATATALETIDRQAP